MKMDDEYYIVTAYTEYNGKKEELYTIHGVKGEGLALEKALYFEAFYKDRGITVKTNITKMGDKNECN